MVGKAALQALKGPQALSEYAMLRIDMRSDNARLPASRGDRKWFGGGRKRDNAESAGICKGRGPVGLPPIG